jgi:hypothetical protein
MLGKIRTSGLYKLSNGLFVQRRSTKERCCLSPPPKKMETIISRVQPCQRKLHFFIQYYKCQNFTILQVSKCVKMCQNFTILQVSKFYLQFYKCHFFTIFKLCSTTEQMPALVNGLFTWTVIFSVRCDSRIQR